MQNPADHDADEQSVAAYFRPRLDAYDDDENRDGDRKRRNRKLNGSVIRLNAERDAEHPFQKYLDECKSQQ